MGTFLQKFAMKQLSPFQLEVLMTAGMAVISIPALFITQKNLAIPVKGIPMGALVGILFASGSLLFTLAISRMNAGIASALSITYVVIVVILSGLFLKEEFNFAKILGIALTIIGVGLLYTQHK